jgi:hypothetical protein
MKNPEIDKLILAFDALKTVEKRLKNKVTPSFIGIGPGRAGSSSLYGMLSEHPEVYVSPVKEVNYFGFRSFHPTRRPKGMSFQDYTSYFSGGADAKVSGEISPSYFILPEALSEIAGALPGVKIISGLRNPIERLASHYRFHAKVHGVGSFDEFITACRSDIDNMWAPGLFHHWGRPVRILASSMYAKTLNATLASFGKESTCVYLFEDFVVNVAVAKSILKFLGVDDSSPVLPNESNAATRPSQVEVLSKANFAWLTGLLEKDLAATQQATGLDLARYGKFADSAWRAGIEVK